MNARSAGERQRPKRATIWVCTANPGSRQGRARGAPSRASCSTLTAGNRATPRFAATQRLMASTLENSIQDPGAQSQAARLRSKDRR